MTRRLRISLVLPLALAAGALVAGCKQGVGDRCQVDEDCQDTLVCIIPSGASLAQGGSCQPVGAAVDMGSDLSGPDLAVAQDLAGADQSSPDLTATDGG